MAISLPKGGEINRITTADKKYHPNIIKGPSHPNNSANFLENKTISSTGFVKFKYRLAKANDHLSKSYVNR